MKKFLRFLVIVLVAGAIAALVAMRMMKPAEEIQTKELPAVTLTKLYRGDISEETSLMGTIQPSDTYYVMPKAAGELLEVFVENGQQVQKGDPIARIDNQKAIDAAKYTLEQASVQANTARDAVNRVRPLYEAGDISAQDYETARAQADAASAGVSAAKLNYDTQVEFATVVAPAAGTIQNSQMTVNAMVAQSTQLCVITGTGAKGVRFDVTEEVLRNLKIGQQVTVTKQGMEYTGEISEIGAMVNPQTGMFSVKAAMQNAESLPDGASCKIRLTADQRSGALLLPIDCLYYSAGNAYVYLYKDGKAVRSYVTTGLQDAANAEIIDGVTEADEVVNSWTDELYDGAEVRIAEESGLPEAARALAAGANA